MLALTAEGSVGTRPEEAGMDRGKCPGPGIYQNIKEETKR